MCIRDRVSMSSRSPRSATACRVGSSRMESLRFAPSMTPPLGIPSRSVATDHFQPILARAVGLGPVPSPPHGVQADDPVVAGDGFFDELVGHPGGQPFGAPGAQGGLTGLTEPGCDVPAAAGDQPNEDPLEAVPVRDAQPVAAQWVVVGGPWW